MKENERKIYEEHIRKEELYRLKFELMGMLLDQTVIRSIIANRIWESLYIYGGGYIGIQAYKAFSRFVEIVGIIDRSGGLTIPIDGGKIYSLEEFVKEDDGRSPVVITPIESAQKIYQDLSDNVDEERIYYINELF